MQRKNLSKQVYKAWRLLSIATIISSLFFFALFFIFFLLGYSLVLSESDLYVAGAEFILMVSTLGYYIRSLHWKPSTSPYSWLFAGIAQYFDFSITYLDSIYTSGHELNPIVVSNGGILGLYNLLFKLVLLPVLFFIIQFRFKDSRAKRISGSISLLFMLAVIIDNVIPLVI